MTVRTAGLPVEYLPILDELETQQAIHLIEQAFRQALSDTLDLVPVTAPLFVPAGSGVNDDLNGVEQPVRFKTQAFGDRELEVVQSLAKWKRWTLARLGIEAGHGILAELNAIRPDESVDAAHSIYVDQWEWEQVITREDHNLGFLEQIVRRIYAALRRAEARVCEAYPTLQQQLPDELAFVHAADLAAEFPHATPAEREDQVAERYGAAFIVGVGWPLGDGRPHDGRAPDYDDWMTPNGKSRGLNGDIIVWHEAHGRALELSSMGIRVTPDVLLEQLAVRRCTERRHLPFHQALLAGRLPHSIGGGIGRSRVCMYLLQKAHIGEVQASVWPAPMAAECEERGVRLVRC